MKEFWMVILAVKTWVSRWTGRIEIYCDNEAVCKTIIQQKPKDQELQRCPREFLYLVCKFNPKKGGLQKSLKRVGGGNIAHRLYMAFRTLEWGLRPP